MSKYSEDDFQKDVGAFLGSLGWLWWHTPNGGLRRKREAAKLRAMGVLAGVPDVLIFERWFCLEDHGPLVHRQPCQVCSNQLKGFGVAIELKVGRNKLTVHQQRVLTDLKNRGWLCRVAYTMAEVVDVLRCIRPLRGGIIE